jgi:hypothetical protein
MRKDSDFYHTNHSKENVKSSLCLINNYAKRRHKWRYISIDSKLPTLEQASGRSDALSAWFAAKEIPLAINRSQVDKNSCTCWKLNSDPFIVQPLV